MKNDAITSRDVDFAKWYTDVVRAAKLADYTSVKGCIAIEPNGYAIWEKIQSIMDKKFKELGHVNIQLPLLIPEKLFNKEKELIEGFAPELIWATEVGDKKFDERLAIRSTSETLFCDYYKKHVRSHKDLPKLYNQWCNVFRYEKETRPFLRSREFLWQEGHTVHATEEEAIKETYQMMDVYKWFNHEILAIPSITGIKTEKEKFAGAEFTITNEDLMYNGVCLQDGTSHYFGQKFSKAYDVKFTNKENKEEYAYYTTWGKTTRAIAAIIMVHADDYGLVLPPRIAPKPVVIIPIGESEEVDKLSNEFKDKLISNDIMTYIDDSDKSPGFKFAEAEVNGIPVRIEIGKRDLENNTITIARRDTREKITVDKDVDIVKYVSDLLETIQSDMYNRALEKRESLTFEAHNLEDMEKILNTQPGFIHAMWCGDEACEDRIKEIKGCKSRCIVDEEKIDDKCVCCGKEAKHHVIWGIQY
ncbi:MAG: proline--tRNA ligase [Bacilli bacterium]|nr:proline--tRNA ligase [Bacilli bacterium]MBR3049076.1 proline--tRNA ligase [Bacilli bacterium]